MTQANQATLAEKGNVRIYACGGGKVERQIKWLVRNPIERL